LKKKFSKKIEDPAWHQLNKLGKDELIDYLVSRVDDLEEAQAALAEEVGDMPTYCDKCGQNGSNCFKCKGTGVIKRKQLFEWQW